jgi:hypothetical protein
MAPVLLARIREQNDSQEIRGFLKKEITNLGSGEAASPTGDAIMILFGFTAALLLLVVGFLFMATSPWGPVLIGCGLFLLTKQALKSRPVNRSK